jgi:hypothetical protein
MLTMNGLRDQQPKVASVTERPGDGSGDADAYVELLSGTRAMPREEQAARDVWFAELPLERKDEVLFELEVLLKGIACFANPRNHPGAPRRAPVVAIDFSWHLAYFRDGLSRVLVLVRQLLGERGRTFVFHRYLETVLPDDAADRKWLDAAKTQATPDESLIVLRHALTEVLEVTDGSMRLARVPFRLFYALLSLAQREVARSAHFNPLSALEFRPEFDRITSSEVLDLMGDAPGRPTHRLVALTFLSLFRMLRYLRLVEAAASQPSADRRQQAARIYLALSVLRSDARALCGHLGQRAGALLAESFERDLFAVRAPELAAAYDQIALRGHRLVAVKEALAGVAASVRLEMRRTFERELPSPDAGMGDEELLRHFYRVAAELRPALEKNISFLAQALGNGPPSGGIFERQQVRRDASERLRRDVWMFAQIVRAFASKAEHTQTANDRWSAAPSYRFVREFLAYFQALGYALLRTTGYPRGEVFMAVMHALEDADWLDAARLEPAVREARAFHEFLMQLFDDISQRDELVGVAFDRRAAAVSLRLYLSD